MGIFSTRKQYKEKLPKPLRDAVLYRIKTGTATARDKRLAASKWLVSGLSALSSSYKKHYSISRKVSK